MLPRFASRFALLLHLPGDRYAVCVIAPMQQHEQDDEFEIGKVARCHFIEENEEVSMREAKARGDSPQGFDTPGFYG